MKSEGVIQTDIRLEASELGILMMRNNVGVLKNKHGVPVRYGLANDSKAVNAKYKSHDLIGIRPVLITSEMVGQIIGQFVSREMKPEGWAYKGTKREAAQLAFAELVYNYGGDAAFATGRGTL